MLSFLKLLSIATFIYFFNTSVILGEEAFIKTVAITQIVEHPSLDKIHKGIIDELETAGFIAGKNCKIVYENAQGNMTIAAQIAQKFVSLDPDVIVAISTPSAQTVAQAAKSFNIPVVFGAVTDPISAKLVKNLENTSGNVTGTIDRPQASQQLNEMLKLFPDIQILGILFNPSESNSLVQIEMMEQAVKAVNISIVKIPALKTAEVGAAAQAACDQVDALFIPNDNSIISALDAVLQAADHYKIPVFTSDPESVDKGALAATANDQYMTGRETGKMAVEILQGKKVQDMPVKTINHIKTYINAEKAKLFGIKIPRN